MQSRMLAAYGLTVPPTLVTGQPLEALRFIVRHGGKVLVKGLSSFRTVPEALGKRHLEALNTLGSCPAMFQKIIRGDEFRLTVIGQQALVSMRNKRGWVHRSATDVLPATLVDRCSQFAHHCGLVFGGFDVIRDASGKCYVLEMNPNPLITYYEQATAPVLTQALCAEVIALDQGIGDICV
jgi:glutathione synthase/RimK-type ligase-like ATP-grasp enzyme